MYFCDIRFFLSAMLKCLRMLKTIPKKYRNFFMRAYLKLIMPFALLLSMKTVTWLRMPNERSCGKVKLLNEYSNDIEQHRILWAGTWEVFLLYFSLWMIHPKFINYLRPLCEKSVNLKSNLVFGTSPLIMYDCMRLRWQNNESWMIDWYLFT